MKAIIPIGAGLIISVAGYIYSQRSKDVGQWMKQRRIPSWDEDKKNCPSCGKKMKPATKRTDGKKVWFCQDWRSCQTYIDHVTGERLPAAVVERTDGKSAL